MPELYERKRGRIWQQINRFFVLYHHITHITLVEYRLQESKPSISVSSKTIIPLSPRNQLLYITLMKLRFLFTTLGHIKQQEVHVWHSALSGMSVSRKPGIRYTYSHLPFPFSLWHRWDDIFYSFHPLNLLTAGEKLKYLVKINHPCLTIWSNNLCRNGQAMCIANLKDSRLVSNAPCAMLRTVNLWLCTDFARDRMVSTAVKGSLLSTILVAREWI